MSKKGKVILIVLGLIALIALVLSFRPVAEAVAPIVGTTVDYFTFLAKTVFIAAIGLLLIYWGVLALVFPIAGIILIALGLFLVGYALWPLFVKSKSPEYGT